MEQHAMVPWSLPTPSIRLNALHRLEVFTAISGEDLYRCVSKGRGHVSYRDGAERHALMRIDRAYRFFSPTGSSLNSVISRCLVPLAIGELAGATPHYLKTWITSLRR
jgi:hypothetical protein